VGEVDLPIVCCIVVNWNAYADTLKCLRSLSTTEYSHLSPIVVDNGSKDQSVAQIRAAYPQIELIESPTNMGFGAGNNLGIRRAFQLGAKYIWLLNNDTEVEPDTAAAMVSLCEGNPALGQVGSVLYYANAPSKVQAWGGGRINFWLGTSHHFTEPVPWNHLDFITAASALIPVHVLEDVGLFDEAYFMYWEDTDLSFRIRRAGWRLGVAQNAHVLHKEGASSRRNSPQFDQYVTVSGLRFAAQHSPVPSWTRFMMLFGRALHRFLKGEWRRGWAILACALSGSGKSQMSSRIGST